MTSKKGYYCPIKGCSCKKAWFKDLVDLTAHMIDSQGEEVTAKRMRVKLAEIPVDDSDERLAELQFPHTVEVIKNSLVTSREQFDDSDSLTDFIDRTSSMEATFGFEIHIDLRSSSLTTINCTSA